MGPLEGDDFARFSENSACFQSQAELEVIREEMAPELAVPWVSRMKPKNGVSALYVLAH